MDNVPVMDSYSPMCVYNNVPLTPSPHKIRSVSVMPTLPHSMENVSVKHSISMEDVWSINHSIPPSLEKIDVPVEGLSVSSDQLVDVPPIGSSSTDNVSKLVLKIPK